VERGTGAADGEPWLERLVHAHAGDRKRPLADVLREALAEIRIEDLGAEVAAHAERPEPSSSGEPANAGRGRARRGEAMAAALRDAAVRGHLERIVLRISA
jgi:hypothetical protein